MRIRARYKSVVPVSYTHLVIEEPEEDYYEESEEVIEEPEEDYYEEADEVIEEAEGNADDEYFFGEDDAEEIQDIEDEFTVNPDYSGEDEDVYKRQTVQWALQKVQAH